MHTLVFVVVPESVPDADDFVCAQMEKHALERWDYWRIGGLWEGRIAARAGQPFTVENNMCSAARVTLTCAALLTPDGTWHEAAFHDDWPGFVGEQLRLTQTARVVAVDAHS